MHKYSEQIEIFSKVMPEEFEILGDSIISDILEDREFSSAPSGVNLSFLDIIEISASVLTIITACIGIYKTIPSQRKSCDLKMEIRELIKAELLIQIGDLHIAKSNPDLIDKILDNVIDGEQ